MLVAMLYVLIPNASSESNGQATPPAGAVPQPAENDADAPGNATSPARAQQARTGRIVNGKEANATNYRWMAAIGQRNGEDVSVYCAASLIDRHWLLSAAHCRILAGDVAIIDRSDLSKRNDGHIVEIIDVIPHRDFNPSTLDHDLALLRLKDDQTVAPVSIVDADETALARPHEIAIAGWGQLGEKLFEKSNTLQDVLLDLTDQSKCVANYRVIHQTITNFMFCAQGFTHEGLIADACQGDSGGPAVARDNIDQTATLIGVISKGEGCAREKYPGVYTRLSKLRGWIITCTTKPKDASCLANS